MKKFNIAKARFERYLENQQKNAPRERDIYKYIDSLRFQSTGTSFTEENLLWRFPRNLNAVFPHLIPSDSIDTWENITTYIGLGSILETHSISTSGLVDIFSNAPENANIIFLETGFLATVQTWQQASKYPDSTNACLGYVFDDIAQYYMADFPNRLTEKLNSEENLTREQYDRANRCMEFITKNYISKYNHQPYVDLSETTKTQRVLVVDQSFSDASVVFGKATEKNFQKMLVAAIQENPEAEIWVKTHPDTIGNPGKFSGYLTSYTGYANIKILSMPMNPIRLLEQMDKVYVVTSGMGFEALLMCKKVICFGAPFYAGWGLTDDRVPVPHRQRQRSITDIFFYFYIWYTHYHTPVSNSPCEIEEVLEFILKYRPKQAGQQNSSHKNNPKVSVIIPAYNAEKYIYQCLNAVLGQTLRNIEVIVAEDCSTDNTLKILEDIAGSDARVQILRMEKNIAQGFARNKALDIVRGDYVWFADADDFIPEPDALERLYDAAIRSGADMTRGRKKMEQMEDENGVFLENRIDKSELFFPESHDRITYQSYRELLHSRHFSTWLYRRDFLNQNAIRFVTSKWEERPFVLHALLASDILSLVNCDAERYRIRKNSISRSKKTLCDIELLIEHLEAIVTFFKKFDAKEDFSYHKNFVMTIMLHAVCFDFAIPMILQTLSPKKERLLDRIAHAFRESGFKVWDLLPEPLNLNKKKFANSVYHMLLAALKRNDATMLSRILDDWNLNQKEYYQLLSQCNDAEFTYALNCYTTTFEKPSPSYKTICLPTNPPEILLHVGTTKTGSTFLQSWMELNRFTLLQQGIWYPEFGIFRQNVRKHKQAGTSGVFKNAISGESTFLDHMAAGLQLFPNVRRIILSSESFFLNVNAPRVLQSYLADFNLRMLVYLRRQDEWANSQYCEFIGGGAIGRTSMSVEQWLSDPEQIRHMDYCSFLSRWEMLFGKNVEAVPFEKAQFIGNDLLTDFCSRAGIIPDKAFYLPDKKLYNDTTYSKSYYRLMRFFNQLPFASNQQYLEFVNSVQNTLSFPATAKPQMLSQSQRQTLLTRYAPGNSIIALKYLDKKDGKLFLNESIPPDMPIDESDRLDIDVLEHMWKIYHRIAAEKKQTTVKKNNDKQVVLKKDCGENSRNILTYLINSIVKKLSLRKR